MVTVPLKYSAAEHNYMEVISPTSAGEKLAIRKGELWLSLAATAIPLTLQVASASSWAAGEAADFEAFTEACTMHQRLSTGLENSAFGLL